MVGAVSSSARLSERLQAYLAQNEAQTVSPTMIPGTLEVVGDFLYGMSVPQAWRLRDIRRTEGQALIFVWMSHTAQAVCPACHLVSHQRTHTYMIREIQDLPLAGGAAYLCEYITSIIGSTWRITEFACRTL